MLIAYGHVADNIIAYIFIYGHGVLVYGYEQYRSLFAKLAARVACW